MVIKDWSGIWLIIKGLVPRDYPFLHFSNFYVDLISKIVATALAGPHLVTFATSGIQSMKASSIKEEIAKQCSEETRNKQWAEARADYYSYRPVNPPQPGVNSFTGGFIPPSEPRLETKGHCAARIRSGRAWWLNHQQRQKSWLKN